VPSYGYQRGSQSTVYTDPTKPPAQSIVCGPDEINILGVCVHDPQAPTPSAAPAPTSTPTLPPIPGGFSPARLADPLPEPENQPFPWAALIAGLAGVFLIKS
jgi:hypothetical protein